MLIRLCIDPGHGGKDRANRGPTGYVEADGVLDISLKLRDILMATGAFDVRMTRDKDAYLGVRERGQLAAKWGVDMLISQHTNATGKPSNTSVRGCDVYYSVDLPQDRAFADNMSRAIAKAIGTKDRGGKIWESTNYPGEDYLGVIDAAQDGGVPHVFLIESAFHDNPDDEALLKDPAMRTAIAKAQAAVICNYYSVPMLTTPANVEAWKKAGVEYLAAEGVITDKALWMSKLNDDMPVWAVTLMLAKIMERVKAVEDVQRGKVYSLDAGLIGG